MRFILLFTFMLNLQSPEQLQAFGSPGDGAWAAVTVAGMVRDLLPHLRTHQFIDFFYDSADKEIAKFVRTELRSAGIQNPENIEIKSKKGQNTGHVEALSCFSSQGENYIKTYLCVPEDDAGLIKKNHQSNIASYFKKNSLDNLDRLRAAIYREAGHIKNHDWITLIGVRSLRLLITSFLVREVIKRYQNGEEVSASESAKSITVGLTAAFVTFVLGMIIESAYSRYTQKRADAYVPDDPALLKAAANDYLRLHEEKIAFDQLTKEKRSTLEPKKHQKLVDSILNNNLLSTHPSHLERAQYFQKRYEQSVSTSK